MLSTKILGRFDVVHAHAYGHFPTYLAWVCRAAELPTVITTHSDAGSSSIRKRVFDIVVPRLTTNLASRVIALSQHEKEVLVRRGVKVDDISVIPNGVDIEEFRNGRREGRGATELPRRILYAGRVEVAQKGIDILIEAFALLCKRWPITAELRVAGPGSPDTVRKLIQLARKLGVEAKTVFLGSLPRSRLIQEMHFGDVLVLPSRFEPFGIVLLEAMASGTPIVASRVGAVPEIIRDGLNGLLFTPGDASDLSEKLPNVLTDHELASALWRNGASTVQKYSWCAIAEKTLEVYKQSIETSRSRRNS